MSEPSDPGMRSLGGIWLPLLVWGSSGAQVGPWPGFSPWRSQQGGPGKLGLLKPRESRASACLTHDRRAVDPRLQAGACYFIARLACPQWGLISPLSHLRCHSHHKWHLALTKPQSQKYTPWTYIFFAWVLRAPSVQQGVGGDSNNSHHHHTTVNTLNTCYEPLLYSST